MKKLLVAALLLTPVTAYAYVGGNCSTWSVVYASKQPQCTCRIVRDRGGRIVLTCY